MIARILSAAAAILLVATAAFHATGYSDVLNAVAVPGVPEFLRKTSPGLWLFFSWHLFAVAVAASWAALRAVPSARPLLVFCAALVAVDAAYIFSQAGLFFVGTLMLAGAAVCLFLAVLRWPTS